LVELLYDFLVCFMVFAWLSACLFVLRFWFIMQYASLNRFYRALGSTCAGFIVYSNNNNKSFTTTTNYTITNLYNNNKLYTIMKLLQQQQRTIQLQILYDKLIRMLQLIIYRESDKVEGSIRDLVIFEVETVITWQWLSDKDYVQIEEGNSDYIGLKWMLFEKQRVTKWLVCIWTTLLFVTGSSRLHWMNMLMNDWQKRRLESW